MCRIVAGVLAGLLVGAVAIGAAAVLELYVNRFVVWWVDALVVGGVAATAVWLVLGAWVWIQIYEKLEGDQDTGSVDIHEQTAVEYVPEAPVDEVPRPVEPAASTDGSGVAENRVEQLEAELEELAEENRQLTEKNAELRERLDKLRAVLEPPADEEDADGE